MSQACNMTLLPVLLAHMYSTVQRANIIMHTFAVGWRFQGHGDITRAWL